LQFKYFLPIYKIGFLCITQNEFGNGNDIIKNLDRTSPYYIK
jgi:hypothetical protein